MSHKISISGLLVMTVCCLWNGGTSAVAQNFNRIERPLDRPTFSPYLNMFRGGNGPVMNYFGMVRPQQEFLNQNRQLNDQLESVQQQQQQLQQPMNGFSQQRIPGVYTMSVTGHPTAFMTFRSGAAGGPNAGSQLAGQQPAAGPFGNSGTIGNPSLNPGFSGADQWNQAGQSGGYGFQNNSVGGSSGHTSGFGF